MKEYNFDSLKNLKAPESWIENAVNIPTQNKKAPVTYLKFSRTLAYVACFVLICAISITLLQYKNNSVVKTDPSYDYAGIIATEPQNNHSDNTQSHTEQGTNSDGVIIPPEKNNEQSTTKPTDVPTESVVNPDNTQPLPTEEPWFPRPTLPNDAPGTSDTPTQEPTDGDMPGDPMTPVPGNPSTPGPGYDSPLVIAVNISKTKLDGYYGDLYCALYDPNGTLVGDSYAFSSDKICLVREFPAAPQYYTVIYSTQNKGISLYYSKYSYEIYKNDSTVIYSGICYTN